MDNLILTILLLYWFYSTIFTFSYLRESTNGKTAAIMLNIFISISFGWLFFPIINGATTAVQENKNLKQ